MPADPASRLRDLSPDDRLAWRKTGKLPDAPAASSTALADTPAATAATSDPASEPAHDDPDYKPKTKARIDKLLADNKRLTDELATRSAPTAVPAVSATAAASPAASALVKPNPETFPYGTADPDYLEALTDYKVAKRFEDQDKAAAEATRASAISIEAARIQASWKERVAVAKSKHADFEAIALGTETRIPQGSLIDSWILESEHGADVLYDLQKNPADVDRLLRLSPLAQTRELVKLEERLIADAPKLVTSAPPPGPTLTARAGDTADPVRRAVQKRDTGAYLREANERDLASRRKRT